MWDGMFSPRFRGQWQDEPLERVIWRFMPFSQFVDLVLNRRLWVPSLKLLHQIDPAEGLFDESVLLEFAKHALRWVEQNPKHYENRLAADMEIMSISSRITDFCTRCFASCWHMKDDETFLMWRSYGQLDNPVAIRTTVGRLFASLSLFTLPHLPDQVVFGEVGYGSDHVAAATIRFGEAYPAFVKRAHFAEEQEYRLILSGHHWGWERYEPAITLPDGFVDARDRSISLSELSSREKWGAASDPQGIYLALDPIEMIDLVVASPSAAAWQYSSLRKFSELAGLDPVKVRRSQIAEQVDIFGNLRSAFERMGAKIGPMPTD